MEDKELLRTIGSKIKTLRELKGITQQELAAMCNFEKSNMSRIEAGRTNPTLLTLNKICLALNIELTELFKN